MTIAEIEGLTLFPLSELSGADSTGPFSFLTDTPLAGLFDHLYFTQVAFDGDESGYGVNATLVIDRELVIAPFGDVVGIVLGGGNNLSFFDLTLHVRGVGDQINFEVGLVEVPVALRISSDILRPLLPDSNTPDPAATTVDISLGTISIFFDPLIGFDVVLNSVVSLPRCMIADSGIIVSAVAIRWLTPYSDDLPPNTPADFTGLYLDDATLELDNLDLDNAPVLKFDYAFIGSGGFSGKIEVDNLGLRGSLLSFECELVRLNVTLAQGALIASDVYVRLTVPFFDTPIGVELGIDLAGGFTLALSATQPPDLDYNNGLITLTKPGLLSLTLESVRFGLEQGVFTVAISGEVTPDVGDLDWPTFRVEELSIDSKGNVRLEGGWLDLRQGYVLSFYGFQLEITKIGFGTTDAGLRWVGFSGGLKLVEGLTAGASVEGLRVLWNPVNNAVSLTLSGVGVELDIPDVLYFKGWVSMTEPSPGVFRFDGDITLDLRVIGLTIEAQLVIGYDSVAGYTFFAIYVGVELPAGIPLGQTSLALYGMAGLFALNMEPGRLPDEPWYAIQPGPSWYHKAPAVGVYHLRKWDPRFGSLALGAGVTLGTLVDNGMMLSARVLLVLVLPGPIIMLEGRANLLKERASLRDEPVFRALAVIDGRKGEFLVGIDAQYLYDESGSLIEIGGGTEAYFNFSNPNAWHLYLGIDKPRERRIRAEIFERLFEANAYFMMDATGLRAGAWVGFDKGWKFGPLKVALEAWIEGAADLSFKPTYFRGYLWLHGAVTAKVFGFGFELGADARINAGVSKPFHIKAELSVTLDLPWPFKDVNKCIPLEWGPDPTPPPLPVPLKEVAVEHLKVSTSWPLPAVGGTRLLLPTPDPDNDGFWSGVVPAPVADGFFPATAPVVPLDARPHLTFGRLVHDVAGVGLNPSPVHAATGGWEWIGDRERNEGPARIKLSLLQVSLERRVGGGWQEVASRGQGQNTGNLFGAWAPFPALPGGNPATNTPAPTANVKLWLWSRSPFDYTQRSGGAWEEWISQQYPDYPCVVIPQDQEICCDFQQLAPGPAPASPWVCRQQPGLAVAWGAPPVPRVQDVADAGGKAARALCFAPGSEVLVAFGQEVKRARLTTVAGKPDEGKKECLAFDGRSSGAVDNPLDHGGWRVEGYDFAGQPPPQLPITLADTDRGAVAGLTGWVELIITLPAAAPGVEVRVSTQGWPVGAVAEDANGQMVDKASQTSGQRMLERLRLDAPAGSAGISLVRLRAPGSEAWLHEVCVLTGPAYRVVAQTLDVALQPLQTYDFPGGVIELDDVGLRAVRLSAQGGDLCLTEVCAVVGPDDETRRASEEMLRHVVEGVAHWASDGEVLPAWSQFRLKIVTALRQETFAPLPAADTTHPLTQYAYFRTEGPPGLARLSLPLGHPLSGQAPAGSNDAPAFDSGLDDLTRYVAQTIPPTVPDQPGEKPFLPRPVYCAYDVGVQFNETYVEQMYAGLGRDLGLYLFDNNDQPARDAHGRLLSPPNRWGRQAALSLSRSDERWLRHLDATTCVTVDWSQIARDQQLQSGGQVLAADTLYEARLIPLLLRESFSGYALDSTATAQTPLSGGAAGGWLVYNDGTPPGGRWVVGREGNPPSGYVAQEVAVSRGPATLGDAFPGGTFLLPGSPAYLSAAAADRPENWTDYRASALLRSEGDEPVGLAVRWDNGVGYLFYLDRGRDRRRLVRVDSSGATILAEAPGGYQPGLDSAVVVEATGDRLRVFVDGAPVMAAQDATYARGRVALFAAQNPDASFRDVRVDDLRPDAPVVYRFKWTTSRFVDFAHHVYSYPGLTFLTAVDDLSGVAAAVAAAVDVAGPAAQAPPTAAEIAAYEALATAAAGPDRHRQTEAFDVTRLEHNGQAFGFLIRTSEPIDWRRTTLAVSRAAPQVAAPAPAAGPRLVAATWAGGATPSPLQESATLLLATAENVSDWRIEWRALPDAATPDPAWALWYRFGSEPPAVVGRRVRVFAGPDEPGPPAATGEEQRFGDAVAPGFQPAFPAGGVELRLVWPDGRVAHVRRFLPPAAYAATAARLLRSADGTGLILLQPDAAAPGSLWGAAEYRLRWEFRRDNSALAPDSLVLSRDGDTTPEVAEMDIPWVAR